MRATICCCLVTLLVGCENVDRGFPNPGPEKFDIKVLSGTSFLFAGQRCQLLGTQEDDDPKIRERGKMFADRWFNSTGNIIGVYNSSNPIRLKDGTCLVWVRGYDSSLSCLNLELVRAGLAKVDYSNQEDYTFLTTGKDHDYPEEWQQELRGAEGDHRKGVRPKVSFDWYEASTVRATK